MNTEVIYIIALQVSLIKTPASLAKLRTPQHVSVIGSKCPSSSQTLYQLDVNFGKRINGFSSHETIHIYTVNDFETIAKSPQEDWVFASTDDSHDVADLRISGAKPGCSQKTAW